MDSSQKEITVDSAYSQALEHFNSGRYAEADKFCTAIIQAIPNHIDAINLIGVIAQKINRHDLAVEQFKQAINIDSSRAMLYYNLGASLYALSRHDEALQVLSAGKVKEPDNSHIRDLISVIQNRSSTNIGAGEALSRGIASHQAGNLDEAANWYGKALEIDPASTTALCNLGTIMASRSELDQAVVNFQKALSINPNHIDALSNLGLAFSEQGRFAAALVELEKVLAIKPDHAEAHNAVGIVLKEQGRFAAAVESLKKAIAISPGFADAYSNLGNALKAQGRLEEAVDCQKKAIAINPKVAEAHSNLGNALNALGRLDEAVYCYQKAITLNPDGVKAYYNLGNTLIDQGNFVAGVKSYRQAIALNPDYLEAHSNLIFVLPYVYGITAEEIIRQAKRWDKQFAAKSPVSDHANIPDPEKPLRIGYVSPDFRDHAVAYLLEPLIASHNPDNVEIFCYAEVMAVDNVTERFMALANHWRSTVGLSDIELLEVITKDKIDILVDCGGHTAKNRLSLFSHKPAPVQIS
ncbi:MAG: tetratricopeptide repeat protein, partial [Magnetococcales bacterium]|nr:tetratricopeptide repeat protein [Magnetococcales bacterium]